MDDIMKLGSEPYKGHVPTVLMLTLAIVVLPIGRLDGVVFHRLLNAFSGPSRTGRRHYASGNGNRRRSDTL